MIGDIDLDEIEDELRDAIYAEHGETLRKLIVCLRERGLTDTQIVELLLEILEH